MAGGVLPHHLQQLQDLAPALDHAPGDQGAVGAVDAVHVQRQGVRLESGRE